VFEPTGAFLAGWVVGFVVPVVGLPSVGLGICAACRSVSETRQAAAARSGQSVGTDVQTRPWKRNRRSKGTAAMFCSG
jgi:hypothetical protein